MSARLQGPTPRHTVTDVVMRALLYSCAFHWVLECARGRQKGTGRSLSLSFTAKKLSAGVAKGRNPGRPLNPYAMPCPCHARMQVTTFESLLFGSRGRGSLSAVCLCMLDAISSTVQPERQGSRLSPHLSCSGWTVAFWWRLL